MKRFLGAIAFGAVVALTAACSSVTPDEGEEAVIIRKPWLFGSGGIDPTPVTTGRAYVALSTEHRIVNMQPMQFSLSIQDLMSADGVPLDFEAKVQMKVTDSVKLVSKFGGDGWYPRNVEAVFQKALRDAVKKRGMNETAINASAAEAIDQEVTQALVTHVKTIDLPVAIIDVNCGRANPPDAIKNQRIATAEQEQRVNTEKMNKLAEDQRLLSEQARAAADNAYRLAMQLSPQQYLQLEQIKLLGTVCAGGKCTFVNGGVFSNLPLK